MDRKVWIDFNMDGLFTNDELVMNELNAQNLIKRDTVTVSTNQPLGTTRMRIGVTYAGTQLNSSVTFLGLFKDFVVNFPQDTIRPMANLRGGATVFAEINKTYNDSGITAMDNIEGNISAKYEIIGSVDNTKVGPNYLKYIVRDLYGNVSDTLYRTVFVILNQTGPSIQLAGSNYIYVEVYNRYNEPGFAAKDNNGNSITNQVIVTSTVDTAKLGLYGINYTVIDAFGLSAAAGRAVQVGDTTRPTITPLSSPYIHQVGTAINLPGIVRLRDNFWSKDFITLTVQGIVNVNQVGSYFVIYNALDNSGNIGNQVVLEVRVQDTKAPEVTLSGANPLTWNVKIPFVDPGFSAKDNFWPANTVVVIKKGTVNVNLIGDYTIWYVATDPSGNKDSVSRLVRVRDIEKPIIDLLNINTVNLARWKEYNDLPVAIVDNYDSDSSIRANKGFVVTSNLPFNGTKYWGDAPGLYSMRYRATDLSGNQSDEFVRTVNVLNEGPASVSEVMNIEALMSVYPNPTSGRIYFRLVERLPENASIGVYDMLGKSMLQSEINGNILQEQELNLGIIPSGVYLLKVKTGDKVYMKKIQVN
jgi:hypothetical protein